MNTGSSGITSKPPLYNKKERPPPFIYEEIWYPNSDSRFLFVNFHADSRWSDVCRPKSSSNICFRLGPLGLRINTYLSDINDSHHIISLDKYGGRKNSI